MFDVRLFALPVGRRVLRNWKGVANDISKPDQDEHGYDRLPVTALAELSELMRFVRSVLREIRQPIVVFRSGADHVIPRSNAVKVLERIGSERKQLVDCPNSYHVVTLDHDAPLVRDRVLAFANELDAEED